MTRLKILALDDDEPFLSMMKEMLESKGFEVVSAASIRVQPLKNTFQAQYPLFDECLFGFFKT